jgi:hypothetical protein
MEHPHSAALERVLARLDAVRPGSGGQWQARCPAHDDRHPSLSVALGNRGAVLLHCHAGCDPERVLAAVGLAPCDLLDQPSRHEPTGSDSPPRIVAQYPYRDAEGALRYEVVRFAPKAFRQRRPDGHGGWVWNIQGVERVLYRLPEVIAAARLGQRIYLVEGEKDADRLAELSLHATTGPQGAGKWQDSFGEALRGAQVVILPDNDEPGREHALMVARSLLGIAASAKVLALPDLPHHGDVSDWLAAGGSASTLERLADDTADWIPHLEETLQGPTGTSDPAFGEVVTRLSDVQSELVRWLWPGRIPLGKLSILDGDPGLGKSLLTLDLAARVSTGREMPDGGSSDLAGPAGVLLLTAEDGLADTIRPRAEAAGADCSRILALEAVREIRASVRSGSGPEPEVRERPPALSDIPAITAAIRQADVRLVIVDPLMAFIPAGLDTHRDAEIRVLLRGLARLAEDTGVAVLLVRHLTKANGGNALYRGGGSIGIIGAARSGLLVARDPNDPELRVLAVTKSNLAAPSTALAYRVTGDAYDPPRVSWEGATAHSVGELLGHSLPEKPNMLDQAKTFVLEALAAGPRAASEVAQEAAAAGVAAITLRRAREALQVETRRDAERWIWVLPGARPAGASGEQLRLEAPGEEGYL